MRSGPQSATRSFVLRLYVGRETSVCSAPWRAATTMRAAISTSSWTWNPTAACSTSAGCCSIWRQCSTHKWMLSPNEVSARASETAHQVPAWTVLERTVDLGARPHDSGRSSLQADQRLYRPNRLALGASLEVATRQDQADDGGRAVEVGRRFDAGGAKHARRESREDAVAPAGARPNHHQRVHVHRSVYCHSPGSAVETTTGHELHGGRGPDEQPGHLFHRQRHARQVHDGHGDGRNGERDGGGQAQSAGFARPCGGFGVGLVDKAGARPVGGGGHLADLVTCGFDRPRQLVETGDFGHVAHRGDFRGQVYVGFSYARRLAQVALDPVHTRGAAHALYGQLDLGRGRRSGGADRGDGGYGLGCLHTPREYICRARIRQQDALPRVEGATIRD